MHKQPQAAFARGPELQGANGCLPIGIPMKPDIMFGYLYVEDQSTFVSMLNQFEQRNLQFYERQPDHLLRRQQHGLRGGPGISLVPE